MPIFQYDAYRNPYGPSIAEALQQQGQVAAAGALREGNLRADAAQQRGAMQAQMFGTVGQAIAGIPQQMRANREMALREEQQRRRGELDTIQLDEARRARDAEQRIGAAYEASRGDDGTVDFEKFQAQIPGADMRYAQPLISAADQSATRRQTLAAKKLAAVQDVAGGMLQSGDLSPASVTEFLHLGRQNGVFTDAQVAGHVQSMADDPTAAKRVLLGIVGPQKPIEQDPDKPLIHPLTGDVITPAPGKPVVNEFKQADNVVGPKGEPLFYNSKTGWFQDAVGTRVTDVRIGQTTPTTPAQDETARHNKELGKKTSRPMLSGDVKKVTDLDNGLNQLTTLRQEIGTTGTVSSLGAQTPKWFTDLTGVGADAQSRQAQIDRVKQLIGKTLEGGVLRKEDEIKYEKILPTIGDPPAVAAAKLTGLEAMLRSQRETTLQNLDDAGFNVAALTQRGAPNAAPVLRKEIPGHPGKFAVSTDDGKTWKAE